MQGELYAGETDKRALLERGLEAHDAVLVEGRSPTLVVEDLTVGNAAFLMGYVTLMWVQAAVGRTRERVTGRTDLREAAERAGADCHDRTDADTATVYELLPDPVRYLLGAGVVGVLALCVLVGVSRLLVAGFALSIPYMYTTLAVVFVKYADSGRASHMADAITALAEERSYDRVAVLCGDAHRENVGEALERREWSVRTHRSRHPLGRLLGW